ncbi:SDR family NAD(P)-dependent oxidoreductase [Bacillus cereus group sp. N34]|uniref:type I polyketide synthase n=1 Tax=Bacillus cereus group sp. N34 TaxID=2794595 RepID=UPI0018F7C44E|nr:SDR family NAD(P)-dependent oxidoreductase [Bacillus cereus group sp. N34]MBJ8015076.1 SDR family NAD(P)-dependent oxidoreductase [Bacillus cereus group sp. N34]
MPLLSDFNVKNLSDITEKSKRVKVKEIDNHEIAIIGMSVRLPMANNLQDFWLNIQAGVDCTSNIPIKRREFVEDFLKYSGEIEKNSDFLEGGYLKEVDKFDAEFFNILPTEAILMSPEQRLFLECAWEVLEDAGYSRKKINGTRTGVYVGFTGDLGGYNYRQIIEKVGVDPSLKPIAGPGNLEAILASRISYLLDLRGPAMLIDTACSSSLVAVHQACNSIRNGDCEMAIAGGIRLNLIPLDKEDDKVGMESSDGKTRAFDNLSDGASMGEGVAAILLKPLSEAKRDGDYIYATIKGSAINQDGASIGITAPNVLAQTDVIINAWKDAGINPESISYIETHGTGTKIGDPIEIDGLTRAFKRYSNRKQFVAISSLKSNIGHLYQAAGISGLIKAVLALKHRKIPPTLHFQSPNSGIDFLDSPLYVNNSLREWREGQTPRRCGVSSFGFSGTNAHIILEEAPNQEYTSETDDLHIFTLSANSSLSLKKSISKYNDFLKSPVESTIEEICYTANTGRNHYTNRLAIVVRGKEELKEKIQFLHQNGLDKNANLKNIWFANHSIKLKQKQLLNENSMSKKLAMNLKEYLESILKKWQNEKDLSTKELLLNEIAELYVKGLDIEFDELYINREKQKISLPTYSFERSKYWIDIPQHHDSKNKLKREISNSNLFYKVEWKKARSEGNKKISPKKGILVFNNENGLGNELINRLRNNGCYVFEINYGSMFHKITDDKFVITGSKKDYEQVVKVMIEKEISQIIHLGTVKDYAEINNLLDLEISQQQGIYSIFNLTCALVNSDIGKPIDIVLVARNVNLVTGEEKRLKPEQAPFFAIGKVINQEYGMLNCRGIDIDTSFNVDHLINEISKEKKEYLVAYREGIRYIEEFGTYDISKQQNLETKVREGSVYVITGGTGGLGLEIAKNFASQAKVKLALLNRTKFPPRQEWSGILKNSGNNKLYRAIKMIQEIEDTGSEVFLYDVNINDYEKTKIIINSIRNELGTINGVVHCAGVAGDGFIITKEESDFQKVFQPKVHGTWILDNVTDTDDLDFFIMFSSGASLIGEAGQSDYCAANAYQDAFAHFRSQKGKHTLAINWVKWKEVGLAVDKNANQDGVYKMLPTNQAIKAFNEIIRKDVSQTLIGELNLESDKIKLLKLMPFNLSLELRKKIGENNLLQQTIINNKELDKSHVLRIQGRNNDNYTKIEKELAEIYQSILGVTEIDIYDNFFELGGNSILLNMLFLKLQKEFPGKLKLTDLFTYTSIHRLSCFLNDQLNSAGLVKKEKIENNDLHQMLEKIENGELTIENAVNLFS